MILPSVTGSIFFNKNVLIEIFAPYNIPNGMMNIFATQFSKPNGENTYMWLWEISLKKHRVI